MTELEDAFLSGYNKGREDSQEIAILSSQGTLAALDAGHHKELAAGLRAFVLSLGRKVLSEEEFTRAKHQLIPDARSNQDHI